MIHLKSLKSFKTMDFFFGKEKPSPLEFQKFIDCLEYLKNIEVYESSYHEEEETFLDVDEIEHFFSHSTATKKANDERKQHLQIFHLHHKTTENLNLWIKEDALKTLEILLLLQNYRSRQ